MKFIFYSISNDFEKFHRRNEIEALVNLNIDTEAIYFTSPKLITKGLKKLLKKVEKQTEYYPKIMVCSLYVLMPLRWALRSSILTSLFITTPIKVQVWYAKKRGFSGTNNKNIISWFYKPDQYLYLKVSNPYIYLHYDNYKGDATYKFSSDNRFDKTLANCVKNSSITLISSYNLFNNYKYLKSNGIHYYSNAISRALISSRSTEVSKEPQVVIGFIGQLDKTFDTTLVDKIASNYPSYLIKLIGNVSNDDVIKLTRKYINVESLGYMKYEKLREQIETFSIGICPYIQSGFNKHRNPLKITEYFSYGIPVVTVECDFDRQAEHLLSVATSEQDFIELIERELQSNNATKIEERKLLAKNNCWDNRAEFVLKLLDNK
ncbi:hypothetical protein [Pseudoalteromonas sp. SR41-1]|uniref:hypothetical protein n=1 Tax=Pseudoalteromonas sp. SR41-1 TaxID=2760952 RepID=UPI001602AF91|nr:hypothetical protein [Pseudoalteromonas sp. SR41-1]MBB1279849.1 hypothetical protein [Pseudoalteromonas sp. SR41-1]